MIGVDFVMRKTKIVCTIGPASSSEEIFKRMCLSGLNVARLNFSHGTHEEHIEKFNMIKIVSRGGRLCPPKYEF